MLTVHMATLGGKVTMWGVSH